MDNKLKKTAESLFGDLGVKIVSGSRFLGGYIGNSEGREFFVRSKVKEWVHCVEKIVNASKSQPQAAYAALAKSIQHEWSFCIVPPWFEDLKNILWSEFWPSLFGGTVSDDEACRFVLLTNN